MGADDETTPQGYFRSSEVQGTSSGTPTHRAPEQFPAEVRKRGIRGLGNDWEVLTDARNVEKRFLHLKNGLEKLGVDIMQAKVLEVGTGEGAFLKYLQSQGVNVVGIDARPRQASGLPIAGARAEQLPFKDNAFTVVLSCGVFDSQVYEQNQELMNKEISRVLAPGGIYVALSALHTQKIPLDLALEERGDVFYKKPSNS